MAGYMRVNLELGISSGWAYEGENMDLGTFSGWAYEGELGTGYILWLGIWDVVAASHILVRYSRINAILS